MYCNALVVYPDITKLKRIAIHPGALLQNFSIFLEDLFIGSPLIMFIAAGKFQYECICI